jgi:hypothetical protein
LPFRAAHSGIKQIATHLPTPASTQEANMESYVVRIYRRSPDSAEVVGVVQFIEKNTRHHFHSLAELVQSLEGSVAAEPLTIRKPANKTPLK